MTWYKKLLSSLWPDVKTMFQNSLSGWCCWCFCSFGCEHLDSWFHKCQDRLQHHIRSFCKNLSEIFALFSAIGWENKELHADLWGVCFTDESGCHCQRGNVWVMIKLGKKLSVITCLLFAERSLQRGIFSHASNGQIVLGGFPRVPSGEEEAVLM